MVYVKSNYSQDVQSRLTYVFDEPAHDHSDHRVLSTTGNNVHFWGLNGHIYRSQSGYFLAKQFENVRKKAKNPHKRHQAQHLILSFSEQEFPTNDATSLIDEADQINTLVAGFMRQHFSDDVQWTSGVQCDGEGHKLHSHLIVNPVKLNGKTIPTNKFKVEKLRGQWNRYLEKHYARVTGRTYDNPFAKPFESPAVKHPNGWQHDLEQLLIAARAHTSSIEEYEQYLKDHDVTISQRNKAGDWSYHMTVNGKAKTVRDFYQRKDKKTGKVKSTRGIGKDFTPSSLKQYFAFKKSKEGIPNEPEHGSETGSAVSGYHQQHNQQQRKLNELANRVNHEQHQRLLSELNDGGERDHRDDRQPDQAGPSTSRQ